MVKNQYFFGRANAEIHTIMGCACGFVKDYLVNAFPTNYFRNYFISTRLGAYEVNVESNELLKQRKTPILSIQPRFDFGLDSNIMGLMSNPFYTHSMFFRNLHQNYPIVLHNDEDGYTIAATPDRYKVDFEIKIQVNSYLKLLRLANFVRRRLWMNRPFYVNNVAFETEIPKSMIKILLDEKNVDKNNPESVKEFHEYIERFSKNTVSFKKVLSTGNNAHTYKYVTDVLCRIESVSNDEYTRNNQIEEDPTITIGMWIEFWAPATYIFRSANTIPEEAFEREVEFEMDNDYQIFTYNSIFSATKRKNIGNYSLIDHAEYLTDNELNKPADILDISSLFGKDLQLLTKYIMSKGEDIYTYFLPKLFMDFTDLEINNHFTVDFDNLRLINNDPRVNYKYTFLIYGDLKLIKDKLEEMYKEKVLKNFFQDSYKKTFSVENDRLKVTFNKSIENSIIVLNGYFYDFEVIDDKTVLFLDTIPYITEDLRDNKIHVYNWENVEIDDILTPISYSNEILEFNEAIPNGILLVYQGRLIECSKMIQRTELKIISNIDFNSIILDDFRLYTFKSIKPIKTLQFKGINTTEAKINYYNIDISRAIITVNGLVEDYEIYERYPKLVTFISDEINYIKSDGLRVLVP